MKKVKSKLDFKKRNIVELNSDTLSRIIGGVGGDDDGNDGGTTETGPTKSIALSTILCEND